MLRWALLFILLLSIQAPPQNPLMYNVTEVIDDVRYQGTYNVTVSIYYSYVSIDQVWDVYNNGSSKLVYKDVSIIGPDKLRYPIVIFDPNEVMNATFRIINRITHEWNGTRANVTYDSQQTSVSLGGKNHKALMLRIFGARAENNKTLTLQAVYELVSDLGITYSLTIEVSGARNYKLSLSLVRSEEESVRLNLMLSITFILIGFIAIVSSVLLLRRYFSR